MNPLIELKNFGQSIWFDNIRRSLLTSGELRRMMDEYGVTGVTSNPTIFEKAVSAGTEYDGDIARLVKNGLTEHEILSELTAADIRLAADILLPVYKASGATDGFVSIEVRPSLARDAGATIEEARRLHLLAGRENVMVKVPATAEGVAAIEELVYEGYNINVTLLFSVKRYEETANAYVRALERRAKEGKPLDRIFGVASFFVSRVDTLVDAIIEEKAKTAAANESRPGLNALIGKAAIANAKCAGVKYRGIFEDRRFKSLVKKGARPQRLLWGSTGTKSPVYSDVKYVEGLVGRDTINTMPLQTITAFHDHGKVAPTLTQGLDEAQGIISALASCDIDYDIITSRLEDEGLKAFADSYDLLAGRIAAKIKEIAKGRGAPRVDYIISGFEERVLSEVKRLEAMDFARRLWEKDASLWKTGPDGRAAIKNALGWLALPKMMSAHIDEINSFADEVRSGFNFAVLLGMGGSSLAPLMLGEIFGKSGGYPRLIVLDSTDPDAIRAVEKAVLPAKTLFIVSSKSGSTIEPLSLFEYFYARLRQTAGDDAGKNFVAITDPGSMLEGFSRKYGFMRLFLNPPDIGGRFSALSFFGLVPAAAAGVDIRKLLYHAERMDAATNPSVLVIENPGLKLGAALAAFCREGRDKLTFILPDALSAFGLWLEQLIAESTGKEGRGIVPVAGETLGLKGSYGADRVFAHIGIGGEDSLIDRKLDALAKAGHPVIRFHLSDLHELGGEFLRWEIATAAAGSLIAINPFNQPDVELAKKLARARLEKKTKKGARLIRTPGGAEFKGAGFDLYIGKSAFKRMKERKKPALKAALKKFFSLPRDGDYFAVLAYCSTQDARLRKALGGLQKAIRDLTGRAVQFGFGPRYLHSTGQLHKGGADNGVFLIFTHDNKDAIPLPESRFSFGELIASQAAGDIDALESTGRRTALFNIKDMNKDTLKKVIALIKDSIPR
ncbi:MAG: bifunctional transaldolase/phosoglucose isomerase [Deltaproteobacteria bacterium]|nr:bifunctional transaldolase/phosoglucose isomerase [Deltaproteobacteria bacterium]